MDERFFMIIVLSNSSIALFFSHSIITSKSNLHIAHTEFDFYGFDLVGTILPGLV